MANNTEYVTLGTKECVEVALYMYEQWQEAMKPRLYIYRTFPDWLKDIQEKEQTNGE